MNRKSKKNNNSQSKEFNFHLTIQFWNIYTDKMLNVSSGK